MSFAGLTFLALWLAGRLRLFVPHSPHGKHIYAYTISAIPLLLAAFIAASRVSDYRHHGTDVVAGTSLGIFFGILGYRYYFPWLDSSSAGTPWMTILQEGTRVGRGEPLLPTVYNTDAHSTVEYTRAASPYSEMAHETPGNSMELHSVAQDNDHPPLEPPPIGR
jgi:diacylglycerol diphosphate phosphatase/phosphatidate phosphatase